MICRQKAAGCTQTKFPQHHLIHPAAATTAAGLLPPAAAAAAAAAAAGGRGMETRTGSRDETTVKRATATREGGRKGRYGKATAGLLPPAAAAAAAATANSGSGKAANRDKNRRHGESGSNEGQGNARRRREGQVREKVRALESRIASRGSVGTSSTHNTGPGRSGTTSGR